MAGDVDTTVADVARVWGEMVPTVDVKDPVEFITKLRRAFPLVNLKEMAFRIEAWWDANPGKRKTKRGLKRFINSWASNEQRDAAAAARQLENSKRTSADHQTSTVKSVWGKRKRLNGDNK